VAGLRAGGQFLKQCAVLTIFRLRMLRRSTMNAVLLLLAAVSSLMPVLDATLHPTPAWPVERTVVPAAGDLPQYEPRFLRQRGWLKRGDVRVLEGPVLS
jgi:hypothetical protein